MGQLHVQQPVIQIRRLRPFAVEQEFLLRLFTQKLVLDPVFVIPEFQLRNVRQCQSLKLIPQFPLGVIPENDTVTAKEVA